jgi:hypothetical protein
MNPSDYLSRSPTPVQLTLAGRVDARLNELKAENAELREFVERVAKSVASPTVLADEAVQLLNQLEVTA